MTKPLIGILGSLFIMEGGMFPGLERAYVNNDYVEAVEKAGGVPTIIPVVFDENVIENQIKNVDGIVLSGGYDINPQCYGEEPHQKLEFIFPQIDEHHLKVIELCKKFNKPLLGICRGMQIINVAYGGTLYQDLSYVDGCYIKHMQSSKRNVSGHNVEIMKDSYLYNILGSKIITNSFHHQCIKKIAPNFNVTAIAKDGIIEAIESKEDNFILGIQWHPEMMVPNSEEMLNIFKLLTNVASKEKIHN
ncbi:gamma-glutamyl-gamma-aminobutyrate hydrolase family protein [Desulfosporosinus metallidurans]|uniref:Para-aminobenzoate synthase, amidotransferase component n=1 Tax=Desulfosporosinus metallidurans TaxID=1888891 RepID=A0A1Q8R041_9FIRM|nr:gamma-glutamyl-gamma-aminobutyrate hydrolase family protein [Desulfosporosinus metallidurans]OLN32983.1 Para-aminobenzoate synthase, amidotransferase component [Desulfosporosinus metallidurans]